MLSIALVGLISAVSYGALLSTNRFAMQTRLQTLAQGVARDRVDRVQSVTPYNPHFPQAQVPVELVLDSARGGPRLETVPLYVDPSTNVATVTAAVSTSVTSVGSYNARAAFVTVTYTFAGREHQVRMNTLRTSDS